MHLFYNILINVRLLLLLLSKYIHIKYKIKYLIKNKFFSSLNIQFIIIICFILNIIGIIIKRPVYIIYIQDVYDYALNYIYVNIIDFIISIL